MKKTFKFFRIITLLAIIGFSMATCGGDSYTYKVLTETFTFSSSDSAFGTLQDGYYRCYELTKTYFNWEKEHNFQDRPENVWTEDQIYSYLIGWGLSNTVAKKETEWLISIDHGIIGYRKGSLLYMLLR